MPVRRYDDIDFLRSLPEDELLDAMVNVMEIGQKDANTLIECISSHSMRLPLPPSPAQSQQPSPASPTNSLKGMESLLVKCGLHEYLSKAAQCVSVLDMERSNAEDELSRRVGMKKGHVHKFLRNIWEANAESLTIGATLKEHDGVSKRETASSTAVSHSAELPILMVLLPGGDGSVFHFKALVELFIALHIPAMPIDMSDFTGQPTLTAFVRWASRKIAEELSHGSEVVLIGYSAGSAIAPSIVTELHEHHGSSTRGLILLDPSYAHTSHPDLATAIVATSVMEQVSDDLDWSMLRHAIIDAFPSYMPRFNAFDAWEAILGSSDIFTGTAQPQTEISSVLLLLCKEVDDESMNYLFASAAGGTACLPLWSAMYPEARVEYVHSQHIDIPFAVEAAQLIVDFISKVGDVQFSEYDMSCGHKKFEDTRKVMHHAQRSFREQWASRYKDVDFTNKRLSSSTLLHAFNRANYLRLKGLYGGRPSDVWATIASHKLHWHHYQVGAWLCRIPDSSNWHGWQVSNCSLTELPADQWQPWTKVLDDDGSHFVRWFVGASTNAAFNELDRHILMNELTDTAFISEPDGDQMPYETSRRTLLIESTLAASGLRSKLKVNQGCRIAIYLPNNIHAVVWIAAAKRLGAPYTAIASGTASASVADRLADTGAFSLITNGELSEAAFAAVNGLAVPHPTVVVLQALGPLPDGAYDESMLLPTTRAQLSEQFQMISTQMSMQAVWSLIAPQPVDTSHPLFILYTSGSTGKPKGIVHAHGGYLTGILATSAVVLDLQPANSDIFFVVATPGWITGQSYMIAAALLCRVPSVLLEGSPVSPPNRFAALIALHNVTILKAGSTFLRMLMTRSNAEVLLAQYDLRTLRLGTFCAEPVNEAVHQFAVAHLTPCYINSYWATEHGGIVWSRCHGNDDQPVKPNTCSWPLPWIEGEVMVQVHASIQENVLSFRKAAPGEKGDVIIRKPYPYLAMTVWSSEGFGKSSWRGDLARWSQYFVSRVGYMQGDTAVRHASGAYTFHGRSDEVMNIGGNRIGTEEIENAILLDLGRERSPLRNCVVVGIADAVLGTAPCAFLTLQPGAELSSMDVGSIRATVQKRVSSVAVPARFVVVPALPETHSGKYMRRLLRSIVSGESLGSLGALRNPECVDALLEAVAERRNEAHNQRTDRQEISLALAPGTESMSIEKLTLTVIQAVCDLTGKSDVAASAPLMDVGLDSLAATHLATHLHEQTGIELSPTVVFEYSSADAIAAHLFASLGARSPHDTAECCSLTENVQAHISVCGLSCTLPAGAATLTAVPHSLQSGADMVSSVPIYRWLMTTSGSIEAVDDAIAQRVAHGGFVLSAQLFDSVCFGISPVETAMMDPQQRLLLEEGCTSLHAGGSTCNGVFGVYIGVEIQDFMLLSADWPSNVYIATGSTLSIAAGRLSFVFGWQGPCSAYATACSASLTAYHASRRGVQRGECVGALAAGVNMMLLPGVSHALAVAGMTSIFGRCHTFDMHANGYARAEGCAVVRLHSFMSDGLCAAGSAVRSDGRSASLTAPNGQAQQNLLVAALQDGSVLGAMLVMHEAHGTGTALGDPIEVRSLAAVTLTGRRVNALAVSSIKANIGHAEPAAGIVGLLKLGLELQENDVAPNAQLCSLNPHVGSALRDGRGMLPVQMLFCSNIDRETGGVSSFGYAGTIVHAVAFNSVADGLRAVFDVLVVYRLRTFSWALPDHPMTQTFLRSPDGAVIVCSPATGVLSALVADHVVQGRVIFPATGYLEMVRATGATALQAAYFLHPLAVEVPQLTIECAVNHGHFEVRSKKSDVPEHSIIHFSGSTSVEVFWRSVDHASQRTSTNEIACIEAVYHSFDNVGLQYGPGYRTLVQAWHGAATALARLQIRLALMGTQVHPADLDDALCTSAMITSSNDNETRLPFAVDGAALQGLAGKLWAVRQAP